MAKIVLRTNLANKNFNIEHKVLETPITKNAVELTISPKIGYSIDAKDFSNGFLPPNISGIRYINSGDKVIAQVRLSGISTSKSNLNISLPISGVARAIENKLVLVDTCANLDTGNVIVNTTSAFTSSDQINHCHCDCDVKHPPVARSYNIRSALSDKSLVLRKTFIAPKDYYFPFEPTFVVTGNSSRYTVESKVNKNDKGQLVYKSFDVYYTTPSQSVNIEDTDSICFSFQLNGNLDANLNEPVAVRDREATKQSEYEIYSFTSGRPVGTQGGVKKVEVKGVPGTPFKIISQDSNAAGTGIKTYNWKTSLFEVGGGMLTAVVPPAQSNRSYGSYIGYIKVPRNTATNPIKTKLISEGFVDHAAITGAGTQTNLVTRTDDSVVANTSITFSMAGSGITVPASSTFEVGPGSYRSTVTDSQTFKIEGIYATVDAFLVINRQPKHDIDAVYHNWDSAFGDDEEKLYDSDGNAILTDWNVSGDGVTPDNSEAKYSVSVAVVGREYNEATGGYVYIDMKVTVSGVQFGTADPTPELDLFNFLTRNAG